MDALEYFGSLYRCKKSKESHTVKPIVPKVKLSVQDAEKNIEELVKTMIGTVKNGKVCSMKAIATAHSREWSNIAQTSTDGYQITLTYNSEIPIEAVTVLTKEYTNNTFVCFEAGATLKEVQDCLWPTDKRKTICKGYRILLNQTGCPGLSLSGTIATAAHGNGTGKPIIADMVRSFRLLTISGEPPKVKQYQIEPKDGITDKGKFEAKFKDDVELIQDDKWFYATLVNIGCMGVVYSYILETEDAYYLKENREMLTWDLAKINIKDLYNRCYQQDKILHSFEVFVCPYPPLKNNGDIQVVICTLEKTNDLPDENIKRPDMYFIQPEWVRTAFTEACNDCPDVVPLLVCLMMNATTCKNVIMDACTAMDPLSGIAVSSQVTVSECAATVKNGDDIIEKIQSVINLYKKIRKEDSTQLVTTPFALRFSKSSKACMAMQHDSKESTSVMIISNILKGTPKEDNTLEQFRKLMMENYKGRPHWGMIHGMDAEKLGRLYPKEAISDFKDALDKFDPQKVFTNEFTKKVFER